jgi:hypothetical protein
MEVVMKPADIVRFNSKIDKSRGACGCWLWTSGCKGFGYGDFWVEGRGVSSHKIAFQIAFGAIPVGTLILHTCDVPQCCNPLHLVAGTHQQNMAHRKSRQRHLLCGRRGETHHHTTLSAEDIRAIRQDPRLQREIAEAYGVRQPAISRIKNGARRAHG